MKLLKNTLAALLGLVIGGSLNMAIVILGSNVIPAPAGVDVADMESVRVSMHLFEPKHFITPFLAHALGTLVGALVAFLMAISHRTAIAYGIGVAFLAGGIAASIMIPAPYWFIALDLGVAYIPMAWVGIRLGQSFRRSTTDSR